MGSYYKAHTQELIDLYRTLAYKSNMNVKLINFPKLKMGIDL